MATPVRVSEQFKRALKAKPPDQQQRVKGAVEKLIIEPRRKGTHRVRGAQGVYEFRINGGNRLTFYWDGPTVVLLTNCDHDKTLARPGRKNT